MMLGAIALVLLAAGCGSPSVDRDDPAPPTAPPTAPTIASTAAVAPEPPPLAPVIPAGVRPWPEFMLAAAQAVRDDSHELLSLPPVASGVPLARSDVAVSVGDVQPVIRLDRHGKRCVYDFAPGSMLMLGYIARPDPATVIRDHVRDPSQIMEYYHYRALGINWVVLVGRDSEESAAEIVSLHRMVTERVAVELGWSG